MEREKSYFDRLSTLVQRHFLTLLLTAYAAATVFPWVGMATTEVILARIVVRHESVSITLPMLLLAGLLLNAGLGAQASELAKIVQRPLVMFAGLVINVVVPVGFMVVLLQALRVWHNPDETQSLVVGLGIVAAMPVAGSSTAWSQNANGNMALSLGLVILSTLLSPITTPFVLMAFGSMASGRYAEILYDLSSYQTGTFLVICVVLPSLAGLTIRQHLDGQQFCRLRSKIKLLNSVLLLFLCYANAAGSLPQVLGHPDWDFLAMVLVAVTALCMSAFAAGWVVARLLSVDESQQRSLMFGLGMNNNGTGMVLACASLKSLPCALLPVLVYNLVQHLVAGSVKRYLALSDMERV
jgi:BASS family bile acid:Na+ symporter